LRRISKGTVLDKPGHSTRLQRAVAAALSTASDVRDAYERGVCAIVSALGWGMGAAWEVDEDSSETLRCVAIWSRDDPALAGFVALSRSLALRRGEGLPGRVWASERPMWITDFATDEELPRHDRAREAGLHAAVCFPVMSERGLVGVLELLGDRPLEPDHELLGAFEVLGFQLGQLVERRRAEDAGHAVEQRHRATLEAALDCVVAMDHRGRVLEFNPAAERTFGYRSDEAVGREMAELIVPPDLRERHRRGLARFLSGAEPRVLDRRVELEAMRADGSCFPVELTITRIDVPGPPTFTGHLRDISDRKLAEAELKASRARIIEAADGARRRIERDLHDGAQQLLINATMNLNAARKRVGQNPSEAAALLDELAADLASAVDQLRELARGIHPAVLTDGGIEPAIRGLARRSTVPAVLVSAPSERYSPQVEATAYFIVAEALTNAVRHASATRVEIEMTADNGALLIEVRDDGIGGADQSGGGLRGLGDRVAVLDGTFEVSSPSEAGTTVRAVLPCAL
jgi:PAS domain S-box-containing protein